MEVFRKKRICFFGRYNPEYPRNKVLRKGLEENGVEVIECRTDLLGIKKYLDLVKKHSSVKNEYDVLLVPFSGWYFVFLAKFLTKKPIFFDALVSIYDSVVLDRKDFKKNDIKAKYFWLIDWMSSRFADKIILDTNEHIRYFIKEFGVDKEKIIKIPLTAMPVENISMSKSGSKFIVHYHGRLVPLQGVEYILEASKLLSGYSDIHFNIIGSRIKKKYDKELFKNVDFIDDVNYEKLLKYISDSDICLGIFGDSDKTKRVIPFKVFEYISMKKPVITADTVAVRELFNENSLKLTPVSNPKAIAEAILFLKNNSEFCDSIANSAYDIFQKKLTPKKLSKRIVKHI